MKFGKQIQAEQVPGWSQYYLDYKILKKIISSLTDKRPATEAASLALGVRPADLLTSRDADTGPASPTAFAKIPPWRIQPALSDAAALGSEDRNSASSDHKTAFFFKLERELEKINTFYLRKEAEYKTRLETLLAQRRAAAMRVLPGEEDDNVQNHVEWNVVEEGFRQLERDLSKLQHYVELNATGFRKILKKWDKRSKSTTKELYLARQVDVQPVFDRQLISELVDTVAACLLDITDLSAGLKVEKPAVNDLIFSHQIATERSLRTGPFHALEGDLRRAVATADEAAIRDVIKYSDTLASQQWGSASVNRILWKAIIDAPLDIADFIIKCPARPFDFGFVDDVSGRTCLHEAVMANAPRLVDICLREGADRHKLDVYGRSAIHYSCLSPSSPESPADVTSSSICRALLEAGVSADTVDLDNYSPLLYAVLRGSLDRVRVLLDLGHVSAVGTASNGDLNPLSLACQAGHVGVVKLLLERGAKCLANTSGEFPMHLAAREGHADVCRILIGLDGWDTPDKYHDWTPVFHAACHGRTECLRVLVDAGSQAGIVDEFGNTATYYAAWHGHQHCVSLLRQSVAPAPAKKVVPSTSHVSPLALAEPAAPMSLDELELIPSLALPPPIMPYRVYGHNFLDKACLVQILLGARTGPAGAGAVSLHPRLSGIQSRDRYMHAAPALKLVLAPGPDAASAPHSVALPLAQAGHVYAFQVPAVADLSLEFSLYPHHGTKTIGRALVLPAALRDAVFGRPLVVPILDHRLHAIGEIAFEVNVIEPFTGVTLEIGGGVETYWKSTAAPAPPKALGGTSAATSPSNYGMSPGGGGLAATVSSVVGAYVHAVVQLTRDRRPVVCTGRRLPEDAVELGVGDATLAQVEAIAQRQGKWLEFWPVGQAALPQDHMLTLDTLLKILPPQMGLCLELAVCSAAEDIERPQSSASVNACTDSVLQTIYTTLDGAGRRRIVMTSFSPDVCAALNWKQPNYPVLFGALCGAPRAPSAASAAAGGVDRRAATIAAAVEFAKANNVLGVLLDAELLAQVPSVVQGIKRAGLLVAAFGAGAPDVDAVLRDGVLVCVEQGLRTFI